MRLQAGLDGSIDHAPTAIASVVAAGTEAELDEAEDATRAADASEKSPEEVLFDDTVYVMRKFLMAVKQDNRDFSYLFYGSYPTSVRLFLEHGCEVSAETDEIELVVDSAAKPPEIVESVESDTEPADPAPDRSTVARVPTPDSEAGDFMGWAPEDLLTFVPHVPTEEREGRKRKRAIEPVLEAPRPDLATPRPDRATREKILDKLFGKRRTPAPAPEPAPALSSPVAKRTRSAALVTAPSSSTARMSPARES